jgi:hypothetical protein
MPATTFPLPVAPPEHEPVRSCKVTPDLLRSWGFEVRGHVSTHDEWRMGLEFGTACTAATRLGWCFTSSHRDHERTWVGSTKCSPAERAAGRELLAWFQANDLHITTPT